MMIVIEIIPAEVMVIEMAAATVMEMVKEKIKDKRYTPLMKKAVR